MLLVFVEKVVKVSGQRPSVEVDRELGVEGCDNISPGLIN
jgi:hypothetical protein